MVRGHAMGEGKGCGSQVMLGVTGWWSRELLGSQEMLGNKLGSQGIPGDR